MFMKPAQVATGGQKAIENIEVKMASDVPLFIAEKENK